MQRFVTRAGAVLEHRPRVVVAAVVLLTVVFGLGLPRLKFDTSQNGLVDASSTVGTQNQRYQSTFGGEPMIVLWSGGIRGLTTESNLAALDALESDLRSTQEFPAVLGPLGALRFADAQVKTVATDMILGAVDRERAAGRTGAADALFANAQAELARMNAVPEAERTIDNPAWSEFLLFDASGEIRPILRDNFPDLGHAVMIVRLPGNADIGQLGPGSDTVKRLVAAHPLDGFDVVATGPPTLLKEINDYLQGGMAALGGMAIAVMIGILFLVFRVRWRLLALAAVVLGTTWSFGMLGYLGIPLTMVTISGLPIFLGLGVDFAIQMHNRFEEEVARAGEGSAVDRTLRHMAPPLLVAMTAAVVGFLALELSRVPMIRDFGVMLVVGTITLVLVAVTLPVSALAVRERRTPSRRRHRRSGHLLDRTVGNAMRVAQPAIIPLVLVSVAIAGAGLMVDGRFPIETEPERWVASSNSAVKELEALREGTQFSSELGILVEADDVTRTDVVQWMAAWAAKQVDEHPAELVRTTSLAAIAQSVHGVAPVQSDIDKVLSVAPADVRASFISEDHKKANIIFPIHFIPLSQREKVLDAMIADLDPPPGVTATPSGLAVIGIELVKNLEANRQMMTLVALGAVFLWLLLALRSVTRALLPLVPVALAVGSATLVLFLLGIVMTPLTTVTGPLAVAVTTEFSVLILYRYREERDAGRTPREAVEGCTRIGRAFVASGLTLLGGFAVLMLSPLPLLVDFGVVVAVIVVTALLSSLIVMPPLLVWVDEHRPHADAQADRACLMVLRVAGQHATSRDAELPPGEASARRRPISASIPRAITSMSTSVEVSKSPVIPNATLPL